MEAHTWNALETPHRSERGQGHQGSETTAEIRLGELLAGYSLIRLVRRRNLDFSSSVASVIWLVS
jgi:hypothetical protein